MEIFDLAFNLLMEVEGLLDNDPDDSGGATAFGIASAYHPDEYNRVMELYRAGNQDELVRELKVFYYNHFWVRCQANKIKHPKLAIMMFIFGVNAHPRTAIKILQRSINNICNTNLVEDGLWGPKTEAAYNNSLENCKKGQLYTNYIAYMLRYYSDVARRRNNIKFLRGWVNRVAKVIIRANHIEK